MAMYEKLGRFPSYVSKDSEEKSAANWQHHQRTAKKKGTLSEMRITDLKEIPGWEWDTDQTWEEQKQNWVIQYTKLQKLPSKSSKQTEERRAGIWQDTQRMAKRAGTLFPERTAELDTIQGWDWGTEREKPQTWEARLQHWITQYTLLQKQPSQLSKDSEEKHTGIWQNYQRQAKKNGKMLPERVATLEATSGWTWSAT